jgi:type II secretory pathway predicted ATPase ExeA
MTDNARFDVTGYPLPKNARGKTFYDKTPGFTRFRRAFRQLIAEPGLGVLSADAGVGKTTAIRNECADLPRPDYQVLYLCDTTVSPMDLYRSIAQDLGVPPSHRRGQLWSDIKKTLMHLVDERGSAPVVVIDEAQFLSDAFLRDLASFLNFAFDSRDLLTLWLVGLPPLVKRLHSAQHAALRTRIAAELRLEPLDRDAFVAAVDHGLKAVGATRKLLADQAVEMLFRSSRGVLRTASLTLRAAFRIAAERDQAFVDEAVMQAAVDEAGLTP